MAKPGGTGCMERWILLNPGGGVVVVFVSFSSCALDVAPVKPGGGGTGSGCC